METCHCCIFCSLSLEDGRDVNRVSQLGRSTIIAASNRRNDGIAAAIQDTDPVIVHSDCRKNYTRESSIKAHIKNQHERDEVHVTVGSNPNLRSKCIETFDFQKHCLFCGLEAQEPRKLVGLKRKHNTVYQCQTLPFGDKIKKHAVQRNDKVGEEVLARLSNTIDLVAAEGRYHNNCRINFFRTTRPKSESVANKDKAFDCLIEFLKENEECQYSICELEDIMTEYLDDGVEGYSRKTLITKLKSHFQTSILVTQLNGKDSLVVFRDAFSNIVHDKWYTDKLVDQNAEKKRITLAASKLVAADIKATINDCDKYPSPSSLNTMEEDTVPETLETLIKGIISQPGKSVSKVNEKKCLAIEQMILSAVRPRSYLSPFLIALGVYLYRKYDSKMMLDMLHAFGMCCSYDEARRYQSSLLLAESTFPDNEEAFIQFAFDNADWNVSSLDGNKSFHSMGGIKCTTPRSDETSSNSLDVPRLKHVPPAAEMGTFGYIPVKVYSKPAKTGLKMVIGRKIDLGKFKVNPEVKATIHLDSMWLASPALGIKSIPGWGGFNHLVTELDSVFQVSDVVALPFINLDPNNLSAVYTALLFAQNESTKYNRKYCVVTFDQPLFIKAIDVIAASPELSSVVARLGGFHLLMSFMGGTGFIMSGSGLEELWRTVYGNESVTHMLDGHSYARALRIHRLTAQALITILLEKPEAMDGVDLGTLHQLWKNMMSEEIAHSNAVVHPAVLQLTERLNQLFQKASSQSRTAKLWIQYMEQVSLMLQFVRAERSGYFSLHIQTISQMQPFFHAAGRLPYAKSSQVYLQVMEDLEKKMPPEDWKKFTEEGYFTIRRTSKFWSGVWSDMTIEQVLMRGMKTSGGLTRGRHITDSTVAQWIGAVPLCLPMCEALEDLSGVNYESANQHRPQKDHAELKPARLTQDNTDRKHLVEWLRTHSPFYYTDKLVSIFSGVEADSSVTCDDAVNIGMKQQQDILGKSVADLKLKRKNRVVPLSAMRATIKVRNEPVVVNEQQMLNRIIAVLQTSNELRNFVHYEFVNYAPSLFDAVSMRKTAKAALNRILDVESHLVDPPAPESVPIVIDGGYLLHAVVWKTPCLYADVIEGYVTYLQRHYINRPVTVVFDGYDSNHSTKVVEQSRRSNKNTSATIEVSPQISTSTKQEEFLGNGSNKASLIKLLSKELSTVGIATRQASADADNLIVSTSLGYSDTDPGVHVLCNDTDVLISLLDRKPPNESVILIHPQPAGNARYVDIDKLQISMGKLKDVILFAHAFTGTDTTSAAYRRGKAQACDLLKKRPSLREEMSVFYKTDASQEEIAVAGEHFFLAWYDIERFGSLNKARFFKLKQMIAKQSVSKPINLAVLPPTSGSSKQHSLRAHYLVQQCRGAELDCTKWGWELRADVLVPVGSENPSAPQRLLELIHCNCKLGCKMASCKCRKAGRACTPMCGTCLGETCSNIPIVEDSD